MNSTSKPLGPLSRPLLLTTLCTCLTLSACASKTIGGGSNGADTGSTTSGNGQSGAAGESSSDQGAVATGSGGVSTAAASGVGGAGAGAGSGGDSPTSSGGSDGSGGDDTSAGGSGGLGGTGGGTSTGADVGGTAGSGAGGSSGSGGSGGNAGSGGSGDVCPAAHECVPRAPAAWSGPIIVALGATPPACPASYPAHAFDAGTDVSASGACECSCEEPAASCDGDIQLHEYGENGCAGSLLGTTGPGSDFCVPIASTSVRVTVDAPTLACADGSVEEELEPPEFGNLFRGCNGATAASTCGAGVCLPEAPDAFDDVQCIYRDGEYECPTAYPVGTLLYDDIQDTRDCPNTCSCSPSGGSCETSLALHGSISGGGSCGEFLRTRTSSTEAPLCTQPDEQRFYYGSPMYVEDSGSCEPQALSVSGSATGASPLTLCCLP